MKHNIEEETRRIEARYRRREESRSSQMTLPDNAVREKDRAFDHWLRSCITAHPQELKILEIGCGTGAQIKRLLKLGFRPENIVGCDLLEHRISQARQYLPSQVKLFQANAIELELAAGSFDIVFQSTVFSSILDHDYRFALANKMWNLIKPGGGILWYDFVYSNPRNPDVRGINIGEVRQLFPLGCKSNVWRLTLLPPLARLVDWIFPRLYNFFLLFPVLRSHILVWIEKPAIENSGVMPAT